MKCAKCGADNKTGAKFCINCGSSMGVFCPNCGAANTTGAKFCVSCGNQFGGSVTQPVVVVKTGVPGWAWGVLGVLLAIALISGLAFSGVLPLNFASNDGSTPPPLQPVLSSPEVSTEAVYCPETGGVILYWNAGYDCSNDSGDPGYRLRYGDGSQDLNTGQFDDQASSIHIPEGWSARLYENVEKKGASHCFNKSVSNLENLGNFDNRNLPINDNVTSMEVFRDGTCGQDLAAGAEPAPMPRDEAPPENAMGGPAGSCGCDCVQGLFSELGVETDDWWDVPLTEFEDYVLDTDVEDDVEPGDEYIWIEFDNKNGVFDKIIEDPNLSLDISYSTRDGDGEVSYSTRPSEFQEDLTCRKNNDSLVCQYSAGEFINDPPDFSQATLSIYSSTPGREEWQKCFAVIDYFDEPQNRFSFGISDAPVNNGQVLDCRDYGCPSSEECVEYKQFGTFGCEPKQQQAQPSGDGQSGGSGSSTTCNAGLDSVSCEAAGGSYHYTFCTNPPCPEWCDCP